MIWWWVNGLGYRWGGKLALGANPKFWNYAAFQLFCILLKMVNNAYTNSMGAPKKPKLKQSCPQIISIRLAILLVRLARQEACKIFVFFFLGISHWAAEPPHSPTLIRLWRPPRAHEPRSADSAACPRRQRSHDPCGGGDCVSCGNKENISFICVTINL